tara:strand:- start:2006 stop:2269 length:264 start_codon:yes stop_codon:yes gene_type:complete
MFKSSKLFLKKVKNLFKNLYYSLFAKNNINNDSHDLTILPGIGKKNCQVFYEAGFTNIEKVLSASDKDLLALPGVGTNFLKRLRAFK